MQGARGCANSGILLFASELDPVIAGRWYDAYEKDFWKDTGWIIGFTEMPLESKDDFMDVDSGPVLCDIGSVSSAFGIGAAKTVGRIDRAAPLTAEVVASSWPTPFGFLLPGLMGRLTVKSWSLGEVALLFSMTRPTLAAETVPFDGHTPLIVWVFVVVYAGAGLFFIWFEIRSIRRRIRWNSEMSISPKHGCGIFRCAIAIGLCKREKRLLKMGPSVARFFRALLHFFGLLFCFVRFRNKPIAGVADGEKVARLGRVGLEGLS